MIAQILLTFFVSICLSIFNIRRGSERENFAEGISSSDEVNIDREENEYSDDSSRDEMLNIGVWPVHLRTSYSGRGGQ